MATGVKESVNTILTNLAEKLILCHILLVQKGWFSLFGFIAYQPF